MMSKIFNISTLTILSAILIASCTKNDPGIQKGEIVFRMDIESNYKSSPLGLTEDSKPSSIFISIKDEDQNFLYNLEELPLVKIGENYVTETIEMDVGSYSIVDFIVVNQQDSAIYLTPKTGTEFESLVENPLPVSFEVQSEDVQPVIVEVIPANLGDPFDYGYVTFSFHVVNTLNQGLLVHFPINGDIRDESGKDVPFALNLVTLVKDRMEMANGAMQFDGNSSGINLNDNRPLITTTEFSIAVWAKMDGYGGGTNFSRNILFSQRDNDASYDAKSTVVFFAQNKNNQMEFAIRSSIADSAETARLIYPANEFGTWHHYAATLDSKRIMKMYRDGVLIADTVFAQTGDFITSVDHVYIGYYIYSGIVEGVFNGAMDDFRIYNRALTHREIDNLINMDSGAK